jgi:YrbI family 3-deoxy-D-manno-octulosonate 8-phosphate phosphatase
MLGVTDLRLGHEKKLPIIREIAECRGLGLDELAYLGDDLVDVEPVSAVGLGVAVADACSDLLQAASHRTEAAGGHGAVRELIEAVLRGSGVWEKTLEGYFADA